MAKTFNRNFTIALGTVMLLSACGMENVHDYRTNRQGDNALPGEPGDNNNPNKPNPEVDPLVDGLAAIKKEVMQDELSYITRDEFNGRLSATEGNVKVADWIINHLKTLGVQPAQDGEYRQNFKMKNGPTSGKTTSNIVAMFPGNDPELKDEYIVIGAHMDHAGTLDLGYTCSKGPSGDKICNGADDNGSGTISVLNITKALAVARNHLRRTVIVMWFSGEEEGLEGSWYYVRNPIVPLDKTVYMINLDMVGYMDSYGNKLAALGGGTSARGKEILQEIQKRYPSRELQITQSAGGGSDHVPFMDEGIPGVFFHTGVSNNPNYHRTGDSPDKIDYEGMLIAAQVSFETVLAVANDDGMSNVAFSFAKRPSLIHEHEKFQTCHHLILNPNIDRAAVMIRDGQY